MAFPSHVERLLLNNLSGADEVGEQIAFIPVWLGVHTADDFRLSDTVIGQPPQGLLSAPDRDLVGALLRHRHKRRVGAVHLCPRYELVNEPARWVPASGDQRRADAIAID